jgi:hypothetical protein
METAHDRPGHARHHRSFKEEDMRVEEIMERSCASRGAEDQALELMRREEIHHVVSLMR